MKKLSILVCHLLDRTKQLKRLQDCLSSQLTPEVEILVAGDNGEMTVSKKRNALIDKATGEYCCFIDDDDTVSRKYVSTILSLINKSKPDCIGIEGVIAIGDLPGVKPGEYLFKHSIQYAGWYTGHDAFYRTPNHLNPIRSEYVKAIRFREDMPFGEDKEFSYRIRYHLRTEEYIPFPIYFYDSTDIEKWNRKYEKAAGLDL